MTTDATSDLLPKRAISWHSLGLFSRLFIKTGKQWLADSIPRLGAALAFYSILSLGPLLLLLLAGAALFFGHDAARGHIIDEFNQLVGDQGSAMIRDILQNAAPAHRSGTTLFGIATLLFGASGVFGQLQEAFNIVWGVRVKSGAFRQLVWSRLLSFLMVLSAGAMLLASLALSAVLSAVINYTTALLPVLVSLSHLADLVFSLGVSTLMFALIFKYVPDILIGWREVWVGALITACLFTIGKFGIALYLGHSGIASSYGAAGSAVVLLVWIYYSAQILLFGAEFTQVWASRNGAQVVPAPHAELIQTAIPA